MYIVQRLYGKTNAEDTYMSFLMDENPKPQDAESIFLYGSAATKTIKVTEPPKEIAGFFNAEEAEDTLDVIVNAAKMSLSGEPSFWYRHYTIQKSDGGERPIDDPCLALRAYHTQLEDALKKKFFVLYNDSAFAYVPYRSTLQCVQRHQHGNYFLKTDFHNFFGSTTLDETMKILSEKIWPFTTFCEKPERKELLRTALSYCFLNGGLPQGSTISPMLTNLVMVPFDYEVVKNLENTFGKDVTYTRYADDCLISMRWERQVRLLKGQIYKTLRQCGYPYKLNNKKTKYGSVKGRNWHLGYMLNGNHEITIGHEAKRLMKADLYHLYKDWGKFELFTLEWAQQFQGRLGYYRHAEPEYVKRQICHVKAKTHKWWLDADSMLNTLIRIKRMHH